MKNKANHFKHWLRVYEVRQENRAAMAIVLCVYAGVATLFAILLS